MEQHLEYFVRGQNKFRLFLRDLQFDAGMFWAKKQQSLYWWDQYLESGNLEIKRARYDRYLTARQDQDLCYDAMLASARNCRIYKSDFKQPITL